ncbi:MAG: hypothetical protein ACTSX6_00250 [Candidatus Heimdallarchaeaceae archaeon]
MKFFDTVVEGIKHIIAKCITVGATYIIANNGVNVLFSYLFNPTEPMPVEVRLLILGASYVMWKEGVIPVIDDIYNELKGKKVAAGIKAKKKIDYFKII